MRAAPTVLVAVATTLAIALLSRTGWAGYVMGAAFAIVLWLIIFCGTLGTPGPRSLLERVPAATYAVAGAVAVAVGGAMVLLSGTTAFWSVGVIMAGVLAPTLDRARRDPRRP